MCVCLLACVFVRLSMCLLARPFVPLFFRVSACSLFLIGVFSSPCACVRICVDLYMCLIDLPACSFSPFICKPCHPIVVSTFLAACWLLLCMLRCLFVRLVCHRRVFVVCFCVGRLHFCLFFCLCVFMCLCVCSFVCLFVCLCWFVCVFICLCVCLFIGVFVCVLVCVFVCVLVSLIVCLSVCLFVFDRLFVCLFVCLCVCAFGCSFVCVFVRLFVYFCVCFFG